MVLKFYLKSAIKKSYSLATIMWNIKENKYMAQGFYYYYSEIIILVTVP